MELRQLRYLVTIAEEENYTRAAERLYVSQPALSQQIQKLEQEVGTQLLERGNRRIQLTAAGEIMVNHAQRVFHELESATVALNDLQGLKRGSLTIGTVQTVNEYLLPYVIAQFTLAHPSIQISVEQCSSDEIENGLESGRFQVGIGFVPAISNDIETELLFEEDLVLITHHSHPLARFDSIPLRQLHEIEMMQFPQGFCTRRLWEKYSNEIGITSRIIVEMNTIDSILAAVAHAKFATVLPRLAYKNFADDDLRMIPITDPTPKRGIGILWRKNGYRCVTSTAFASILHQTVNQLSPP